MRYAFISDIHGNLVALESVLADIQRQPVDALICLGDVATLGPQPVEVLRRLQQTGCAGLMGNHDAFLLNPRLIAEYTQVPWVTQAIAWCQAQLGPAELEYIRSFEPRLKLPATGPTSLLCFHGAPRSSTEGIFANTPEAEVAALLAGEPAAVFIGGHTHEPMLRLWGKRLLVNAGSVGQAFAQRPGAGTPPRLQPCGQYALLTWEDGALDLTLRQVPLDVDAMRQAALDSGWPGAAEWVGWWDDLGYN